ncbi:hypothetical protein [Chitinolyticbacter meiyuanensis]|uniref:hypothetical protein n=1 Tax=Chitinolyticbacter meiyuanensis TaxID=682798 RepID=UPI0011E58F62|nr:hypothetical protein [Chitinolyticbacter meiyuanensis]
MFLVDDVLKEALAYCFKRVQSGREQHDAALRHIRTAMRALASSLREITLQLEAGVHRLRRLEQDRAAYFAELQQLTDADFLRQACNEAGICEELARAQDALYQITPLDGSDALVALRQLADDIEARESAFVSAILEFLAHARDADLLTSGGAAANLAPAAISAALAERLATLGEKQAEIERLLAALRASAYRG